MQNAVITAAVNRLGGLIDETRALRSTLETFGMSKICPTNLTDATEDNGLVLGAREKNPSIEGTLANKIKENANEIISVRKLSQSFDRVFVTPEQLNNFNEDGVYSVLITESDDFFIANNLYLLEVITQSYTNRELGGLQRMTRVYSNSSFSGAPTMIVRTYYNIADGWGAWRVVI